MANYLFIESKSPWESGNVSHFLSTAHDLAVAGNQVTLFLVQNAVLAARRAAKSTPLGDTAGKVRILADDFSLRERGISREALALGIQASSIDTVVDLLASGTKAIWH